tara:strand:+ start:329 stop:493 length:165 start_codon:yes stop_codon:yes gene_type:complete
LCDGKSHRFSCKRSKKRSGVLTLKTFLEPSDGTLGALIAQAGARAASVVAVEAA